jgi:hypothetical protein
MQSVASLEYPEKQIVRMYVNSVLSTNLIRCSVDCVAGIARMWLLQFKHCVHAPTRVDQIVFCALGDQTLANLGSYLQRICDVFKTKTKSQL